MTCTRFKGATLQRNVALAEAMRAVITRYDTSAAAVAVARALAWLGVTGAIAATIYRTGAGHGPSGPQ